MKITKIIKPSVFDIEPPYDVNGIVCEASVKIVGDFSKEWRENAVARGVRRYKRVSRVNQCTHSAVVEIDGTPMCRRHAGAHVLDKFVKGELS